MADIQAPPEGRYPPVTIDGRTLTLPENPVFFAGTDQSAAHHGAFPAAYLALALDATLLALARSARSGQSRIAHLLTDSTTGLPRFLADDRAGWSGLLIAEYVAGSAMASIRDHASSPASVQTISISAGVEDDASFASVAASRFSPTSSLISVRLMSCWTIRRWRQKRPRHEPGDQVMPRSGREQHGVTGSGELHELDVDTLRIELCGELEGPGWVGGPIGGAMCEKQALMIQIRS